MVEPIEAHQPHERLWSRDFTLFFAGRTVSIFGDQMLLPTTITVAVLQAGYGVTGVGYALAAYTAPLAVFVILGGVIVDRFTPVRVMVAADMARLTVHSALAVAFAVGRPALWLILMMLALSGCAAAAFQPGFGSVIPRIARDVQKANAALRVTESLATVAGPAAAGLLLVLASIPVVMAIDAATFGVSAVCLLALRLRTPRVQRQVPLRRDLVQGWQEFRARTWLWSVIVVFMLFQVTVNGPFMTLGPSLITIEHGEKALGVIMSMFGVGAVLGGLVAARLKPRYPLRAGAVGLAVGTLAILVVAMRLSPPLLAVGYLVDGAGSAFWLVMFHTSVQTKIPTDVLGRVHAYDVAGSVIMRPIGQVAAGLVALSLGAAPVLYFSSAMLVVTACLLLAIPVIRNLPRD
ncbi:MFS transporter [Streptomyces sp. NPDC014734]|uniref:MFS transporter n=1 Tax=Streptomyces sp. NPDC014734 TaxID=3364886 RepID=UPI0036FD0FBC